MSLFSYKGKHAEGTAKVGVMEQLRRAGEAIVDTRKRTVGDDGPYVGCGVQDDRAGAYSPKVVDDENPPAHLIHRKRSPFPSRGRLGELPVFCGMLVYGVVLMGVMLHASVEDGGPSRTTAVTSEVVQVQPLVLEADSLVHMGEPEVDHCQIEALAMGIDAVISSVPGGEAASDVTMVMVASTIANRVKDPRYPDTVEDVLCQPYQFSCFSETGLKWVGVAAKNESFRERCMTAAERVLTGERMLSPHVVYVSSARQGTVEAQLDGLYFCR